MLDKPTLLKADTGPPPRVVQALPSHRATLFTHTLAVTYSVEPL